jgi:dTDP-4-amino-4,6-dideoxygalactose transaminase
MEILVMVEIERIANKHNLKVIYDGAHAFGVKVKGKSIFEYGDISTCSLHATKLYHSIEGGLVFANNDELHQKLKYIRNFGISGFDSFAELGINGKNSEFHAAMGLVNLNHIQEIIEKRKELTEAYQSGLKDFPHFEPIWHKESYPNYAYYPILLESEEKLLEIKTKLEENKIQTRRYFYPSLASALPYLDKIYLPNTNDIASRVLCLPLYYDLEISDVIKICQILNFK